MSDQKNEGRKTAGQAQTRRTVIVAGLANIAVLAAFGIFIAGAGFSVFEGILALGRTESGGNVLAAQPGPRRHRADSANAHLIPAQSASGLRGQRSENGRRRRSEACCHCVGAGR